MSNTTTYRSVDMFAGKTFDPVTGALLARIMRVESALSRVAYHGGWDAARSTKNAMQAWEARAMGDAVAFVDQALAFLDGVEV